MYMNYFESSQWAHIVKKWLSNKLKKTTSELEEKYPQPSKQGGQLEVLLGHLKDIPLSERYIRGSLKRTQTALQVCWRSLNNRIRNYIEQKSKVPQYLSGLRKKKRNGK